MHYKVVLLNPDGSILEQRLMTYASDDEAIDQTGAIAHPHEMELWRGENFVARFLPWPGYRPGRS